MCKLWAFRYFKSYAHIVEDLPKSWGSSELSEVVYSPTPAAQSIFNKLHVSQVYWKKRKSKTLTFDNRICQGNDFSKNLQIFSELVLKYTQKVALTSGTQT